MPRLLLLFLLSLCMSVQAGNLLPTPDEHAAMYDESSPAYSLLQDPREGMQDFPLRGKGGVDWVQALRQGYIKPRAGVSEDAKLASVDLNVVMKNTSTMPHVNFSHKVHSEILSCGNCHPAIFLPKGGANFITMNHLLEGQFCGVCHGSVAFDVSDCAQCHREQGARQGLR